MLGMTIQVDQLFASRSRAFWHKKYTCAMAQTYGKLDIRQLSLRKCVTQPCFFMPYSVAPMMVSTLDLNEPISNLVYCTMVRCSSPCQGGHGTSSGTLKGLTCSCASLLVISNAFYMPPSCQRLVDLDGRVSSGAGDLE